MRVTTVKEAKTTTVKLVLLITSIVWIKSSNKESWRMVSSKCLSHGRVGVARKTAGFIKAHSWSIKHFLNWTTQQYKHNLRKLWMLGSKSKRYWFNIRPSLIMIPMNQWRERKEKEKNQKQNIWALSNNRRLKLKNLIKVMQNNKKHRFKLVFHFSQVLPLPLRVTQQLQVSHCFLMGKPKLLFKTISFLKIWEKLICGSTWGKNTPIFSQALKKKFQMNDRSIQYFTII